MAGCDVRRVPSILRIRNANWMLLQEDEAAVVQQWLATAQLAQGGMDRLVGTLEIIEGEFPKQESFYLDYTALELPSYDMFLRYAVSAAQLGHATVPLAP